MRQKIETDGSPARCLDGLALRWDINATFCAGSYVLLADNAGTGTAALGPLPLHLLLRLRGPHLQRAAGAGHLLRRAPSLIANVEFINMKRV